MSEPLAVVPVETRAEREEFVGLPYRLHAADPCWVPPLRRDVRLLLSREKNPFFAEAEAACFLARRGRRAVGRIAAVENRAHNRFHADRVGFFGFFGPLKGAPGPGPGRSARGGRGPSARGLSAQGLSARGLTDWGFSGRALS